MGFVFNLKSFYILLIVKNCKKKIFNVEIQDNSFVAGVFVVISFLYYISNLHVCDLRFLTT